jgi:hypothetical protein
MKFFILLSLVVSVFGNKKKLSRGKKIFGNDANPLLAESECKCFTAANCWLVGDPHLKSFFNIYDKVLVPGNGNIEIYQHEGFIIEATTYGKDWIDEIRFGTKHIYHMNDCNDKIGWLPEKSHTYEDGSTIQAKVYCRKKGRNMHINLLLKKIVELDEQMSFQDWEQIISSTGVCTYDLN